MRFHSPAMVKTLHHDGSLAYGRVSHAMTTSDITASARWVMSDKQSAKDEDGCNAF